MKITVLMQFECCLYSEIRFKKSNQSPNLSLLLRTVLNYMIVFQMTCSFFVIGPRQELDGDWKAARIIPMLGNILLLGDLPTPYPVALVRSSRLMKVSSCLLFIAVLNIYNIAVHWRTSHASQSFCRDFAVWLRYPFFVGEEVSDKEEETEWQQWVIWLT